MEKDYPFESNPSFCIQIYFIDGPPILLYNNEAAQFL